MKWAFSLFFILLRRIRGLAFVIDEKREKILLVLEAGEITKENEIIFTRKESFD